MALTAACCAVLQELQEQKNELLQKVQVLKTDLQDWRTKLESQVKSYKTVSSTTQQQQQKQQAVTCASASGLWLWGRFKPAAPERTNRSDKQSCTCLPLRPFI
jgi:uncharacterized protein YoxC